MNSTITNSLLAVLVVLMLYMVFIGPNHAFGASPAGTTFNTAKVASVAINLASPGANGTSTSILNNDANDRIVMSEELGCESVGTSQAAYTGAGLASLQITTATSSTASPATNANTNTLPVVTVATATPQYTIASSTAGTPGNGQVSNIWKAGSYLTFFVNATNTALCSVGVRYLGT